MLAAMGCVVDAVRALDAKNAAIEREVVAWRWKPRNADIGHMITCDPNDANLANARAVGLAIERLGVIVSYNPFEKREAPEAMQGVDIDAAHHQKEPSND